jgi:hypothetical protein
VRIGDGGGRVSGWWLPGLRPGIAHAPDRSMTGRTSTPPKRAGQSLAMSSA